MKKVLIIDDDAPICWLLGKILQEKYEVILMNNGMEAWSWLSEKNLPDLVISDINMPSLNGMDLLENLSMSTLLKDIPVIMLSGYEDGQKRKQCLDLGAHAYVAKPFQPQSLLEEVNYALTSKRKTVLSD